MIFHKKSDRIAFTNFGQIECLLRHGYQKYHKLITNTLVIPIETIFRKCFEPKRIRNICKIMFLRKIHIILLPIFAKWAICDVIHTKNWGKYPKCVISTFPNRFLANS